MILEDAGRTEWIEKAMERADAFPVPAGTGKMIRLYEKPCGLKTKQRETRMNIRRSAMDQLQTEWKRLSNVADAAVSSLVEPKDPS